VPTAAQFAKTWVATAGHWLRAALTGRVQQRRATSIPFGSKVLLR